jgi:hypothetical protein
VLECLNRRKQQNVAGEAFHFEQVQRIEHGHRTKMILFRVSDRLCVTDFSKSRNGLVVKRFEQTYRQ